MSDLVGTVHLVTGSSQGIGFGIAQQLVRSGASVVVNGRDRTSLDAAVDALELDAVTAASRLGIEPRRVVAVEGSVEDLAVVDACLDAAFDDLGRLDGIVNNVGRNIHWGPLTEITRQDWDATLSLNLTAPLVIVQRALAKGFGATGPAAVVNLSSVGAQRPGRSTSAYSIAKLGVEMLTRALALELGPQGIRVNAVAPGLVSSVSTTPLLAGDKGAAAAAERPLGRVGDPTDIAEAVVFLLSDASSWTTGTVVTVDGGALLVTGVTPASVDPDTD